MSDSLKKRFKSQLIARVANLFKRKARRIAEYLYFYILLFKQKTNIKHLHTHLDTNNACNLRCKYCYTLSQRKKQNNFMTLEQFSRVARVKLAPVRKASSKMTFFTMLSAKLAFSN